MGAADHGSHVDSDEPKTPMWLPALGALLFLIAGIWFATRPSSEPKADEGAAPTASATASAAPAAVAPGGAAPSPH